MAALFRLVHAKWNPPASPEVSFADKTVLITGANTGYGFEAAKHFLALDAARLIIGARSLERGNAARERLQHEFPDKRDLIDVLPLDLNSYKSVTGFAKLVDTNYRNLDVAILNAGVSNREYTVSPEGWEETLQINTLSTVLLALLLLPKMKASKRDQANVHMVIVSSELYTSVTAEEIGAGSDNILKACSDTKDRFAAGGGLRQYSISKLLVMYATKKLASSVSSPEGESQVLVTSCCPGAAITDLGRQYNRWYERMGVQLFGLLLTRTVEEGSRTLVSAATLGAESHGGYWKNDQLKPVGGLMASEECKDLQDQVWGEILEALKSKVPEVEQLAIRSDRRAALIILVFDKGSHPDADGFAGFIAMPQRHRKPSFSGAYPRERPSGRRGIRVAAIAALIVIFFIILTASPVPSAGAGAAKKVFGPAVHEPPIQQEDKSIGEGKWYNDWKWLNPFSDSITSFENGVVLPPIRTRPPIYAFYDSSAKKNEATQEAENRLLLIWRRAWWAQGFRPVILGRGEAMKNELYLTVQAKELDPKTEIEVMRWLAWEQMGTGILANWLVLPMGPYDSPELSFLRRGDYPMLTRYEGLANGLFYGEKGGIRDALTTALESDKLPTAKTLLEVFEKQRLSVDPKPDSIAYYDANTMSTNFKAIETALAEDKPTGLRDLAQLITSHLHLTFLNTFSTGFAILTPFPAKTLTLSQPALSLAHSLATCPDSPMLGTCPPNFPTCTPCSYKRPIQIATPTSYYNTSSLYTIGTLPHPYTLASLLAPTKEITIRHIRRDTERDRWLHTVTESTLGREISGPDRIVSFKETVAADWGSWRGLWMTEDPAIPEHRDLEWHFGFSLPFVNTTDLVPKNQQPTDKELKTQTKILDKAKELIKAKRKKMAPMDLRIKDAVEAWNLADTEAWRFVRALGSRETLIRKKWEKEEKEFAGGEDEEARGKGWGRWFDRA